jgi:PAS domain S-box-containing protein
MWLFMQNLNPMQCQAVLDSLQDGLVITDDQHHIIYANPAMVTLAGIPLEQIVGTHVLTGFAEETIGSFRSFYLAAVNSGKPTKYECAVVTPGGRQTWQGGWLTPQQKDGKFSGITCTVQDLSAPHASKILVETSEARFRELLEAIPSVAVQGYAPDGTTRYWNRASEQLYGYSADEAIGQNLLDLIIPEEMRGVVQVEIKKMFETSQPIPAGELTLRRKDGSQVTVFSSHACVAVPGQEPELFCVDIDLTELRRVEEALRVRESYQRALLDNFPFLVWLKDEESRFLAVNQVFASTFKWPSSDSLIGKNDFDITSPEWANKYRADDQAVMASGVSKLTEEMTGSREPRSWVETYKSPLIVDGKATGTVGFSREITKRKQHETDLLAAKADAETANRAKTQFLAAASHDLRQPIAALMLYVGILKSTLGRDRQPLVDNIQECLDSINTVLDDLLEVSKLDAGVIVPKLSDFAVDEMLNSLIPVYDSKAEDKGLRLRVRPSGIIARTDPKLLRRIIGNLIANAVRNTTRGGVLVGCRQHQGKYWIEVWDTGSGIPADKTAFIFEQFSQIAEDGIKKGSGLGLAIVAQSAKLLNLQIRLQSSLGHGSLFAIELPIGQPQGPEIAAETPINTKPRLRIALIEDNPMVLRSLTLSLELVGHQVIAASDGKSVIESLAGMAPDIVISDYRLEPPENGFEVIESLRNIYGASLPAMIITGDTDPALIRSMAGRGIAVHYKPLPIESLQTYISDAIERSAT